MAAKTKTKSKSRSSAKKSVRRPGHRADGRLGPISSKELLARLAEVGRIGSLFIEGEDVANMLRPECREWTDPDDINFDASVAVPVKKTLLRIEKIDPGIVYHAILWRRRTDDPGKVEVMMAGSMNSSYSIGKRSNPAIWPEIQKCLEQGVGVPKTGSNPSWENTAGFRYGHVWLLAHDSLLRAGGRIISYFQPIRDSREDVAGALELTCIGTDG